MAAHPVNRRFSSLSLVFWNARLILWRNWRKDDPVFCTFRSVWNSVWPRSSRNFFSNFSGLKRAGFLFCGNSQYLPAQLDLTADFTPVPAVLAVSAPTVPFAATSYSFFSLPPGCPPVFIHSHRHKCPTYFLCDIPQAQSWLFSLSSIRELNASSVSLFTVFTSSQRAVYFPSNSDPLDRRSIFTFWHKVLLPGAKRLTSSGRLAFSVTSARRSSVSVYFISDLKIHPGR